MRGSTGREHELALAMNKSGIAESVQGVEGHDGVADPMHQGLK